MEDVAYNELKKRIPTGSQIIDIGGNPSRHQAAKRTDVHSCCPILDPSDVVRASTRKGRFCTHTVQSCTCVAHDAYLSIHSLYYLNQRDVLQIVNTANTGFLVALVHEFPGPMGFLGCGEATYDRQGSKIVMKVNGNSVPYDHPSLDWLSHGYFSNGGIAVAWSSVRTVGDSVIYVFSRSPVFPAWSQPPQVASLLAGVQETQNPVSVDLNPYKTGAKWDAQLTSFWTDIKQIYSYRDWFYIDIYSARHRVIVPKDLIQQVQAQMSMRERTAQNFQYATNEARTAASKLNLPPAIAANVIPYAAAIGFTIAVEQETNILNGIVQHPAQQQLYVAYNQALNFTTNWGWGFSTMSLWNIVKYSIGGYLAVRYLGRPVLAGVGSFFSTLLGLKFRPRSPATTVVVQAAPPLRMFINPVALVHAAVRLLKQVWNAATFAARTWWYTPGGALTNVCMRNYPLGEIQEGASVEIEEHQECRPRYISRLVGYASAITRPCVSRSCQHNEFVAVCSRALPVPMGDVQTREQKWKELWKFTKPRWTELFGKPKELSPIPFDKWVKRWPATRREQLINADKYMQANPFVEIQKIARKSSFVKQEHLVRSSIAGLEDFAPRLIQGSDDRYLAVCGPWLYSFSKYLMCRWNGRKSNDVFYASGITANALGKWFDKSVQELSHFGRVVALTGDKRRFDGTVTKPAILYKNKVYGRFSPPPRVVECLRAQLEVNGRTHNGVRYKGKATVKSGDPDTSSGNTLLCVMPTVKAIVDVVKRLKLRPINDHLLGYARVAGGGDDDVILVVQTVGIELRSVLARDLQEYGYNPTIDYYEDYRFAEFYSGRFWPSSEGTIWGPKIGRVMSKTFYCMDATLTRTAQLVWLRGVLLGMENDVNHIPILRVVVRSLLTRTSFIEANPIKTEQRPHSTVKAAATPETFDMMCRLYGCDIHSICECEEYIRQHSRCPWLIDHPLLNKIVEIDCPDIKPDPTNINYVESSGPLVVPPITPPLMALSPISMPMTTVWGTINILTTLGAIGFGFAALADYDIETYSVLYAPIVEEEFKKATGFLGVEALTALEVIQSGTNGWEVRFAFHTLTWLLPRPLDRLLHFYWNYSCIVPTKMTPIIYRLMWRRPQP